MVNLSAPDSLGHKGVLEDAKRGVRHFDDRLKNIIQVLEKSGGISIISADHGNADMMKEADGSPCTRHSPYDVPAILVGKNIKKEHFKINQQSDLGIASTGPTLLSLMKNMQGKNVKIPAEMKDTPLLFSNLL